MKIKARNVFLFLSFSQLALSTEGPLGLGLMQHDKCNSPSGCPFPGIEKVHSGLWKQDKSSDPTNYVIQDERRTTFLGYRLESTAPFSVLTSNFSSEQKRKGVRLRLERFIQTEMNLSLRSKKKQWVFHHTRVEFKMNRHRNKQLFFTARINLF